MRSIVMGVLLFLLLFALVPPLSTPMTLTMIQSQSLALALLPFFAFWLLRRRLYQ
ncbi:MAG: hypothetical protein H0T73_04745 [Ardenticatenales bacterium]|nr:hypothetical protein [Ardenticatenales bacterium]